MIEGEKRDDSAGGRDEAIARSLRHFDDGGFLEVLARRVAIPSESQNPDAGPALWSYLGEELSPWFAAHGFTVEMFENEVAGGWPFLVAERIEDTNRPTVLVYGHGDTVRGQEADWREGLHPWRLVREGDRLYGRGTADNKGQHAINLAALDSVLGTRGRLGFNARVLIEASEEIGSRGLREFCTAQRDRLRADLLLASDGPRLSPDRPTLFLGSRGGLNFELSLPLREGGHHSGNWGGLLANPGVILAHALASIVDARGRILLPALLPPPMSNAVRTALADCIVDGGPDAPAIDETWGEPGLTPWERVFGWNSFEVLAFETGNPAQPVNAIPPTARAVCQIRFVADSDPTTFLPAIRRHLDEQGFGAVEVRPLRKPEKATRTDPEHPWVRWAAASVGRTLGRPPAILPSLGGTIPNDVFTDILGLPTIWVPHSYAGCSQHAPNEHLLEPIVREGLRIMTGLFWDLGDREDEPV